ncbi:MAG: hybrid sensor histidine kinase/response regulator [Chitinophagaceae bacterium]
MAELEKIKVLYIDDEVNNLIGFKASFRLDYKIFTANNTPEALLHLSKHPDIRVIFCDQRMPDKTGVQFFKEIKSIYPHPIRILLTGYTDIEAVIEAINLSNIFRYVTKPWIDADIISSIEEASRFYMANSMIFIKNEELQKAYDELDKFAYSVTHDVRGPLLSILGAIDVAQYVDNIPDLRDMLKMMEESVKNLDSYIQNIHDYHNVKRGELHIEEIDFNEIVKEQEEIFKLTSRLKNIKLAINVVQHEPFRCDKISLKMILNNLLSNAFKFQTKDNKDKCVDLNIQVATGTAIIYVKDNGIGIHSNDIGEIFNMFYRATTEQNGAGFGLYNVKDALIKLNGEITVQSELGEGSVFKVSIPNK